MHKKTILFSVLILIMVFLAACSPAEDNESPLIGTSGPDFTLENTSGGQTSLSEFQGTPVLLFFHMAAG
ncbi:MAG: redoxin domain-containing protein [Anaerolineaceae bacterium]|nr:redoxin domain-containing protein [Anaerolineaceae bacterium]